MVWKLRHKLSIVLEMGVLGPYSRSKSQYDIPNAFSEDCDCDYDCSSVCHSEDGGNIPSVLYTEFVNCTLNNFCYIFCISNFN